MKKQSKQWMLIAAIVAMIYRNQSNRSVPVASLPLSATKETLVNVLQHCPGGSFLAMCVVLLVVWAIKNPRHYSGDFDRSML